MYIVYEYEYNQDFCKTFKMGVINRQHLYIGRIVNIS